VAEAVWHTRRITLRDESWRGQAERELEPLGLVLKGGTWCIGGAL
jgi:predicted DNA-binding transcriptional regulator YafY